MKTKKTLKLSKETLAALSKETLADVAGGGNGFTLEGCVSRAVCPPTLPLCIPSIKATCQVCA